MKKALLSSLFLASMLLPLFSQNHFWEQANAPQGANFKKLHYSPQGVLYARDIKDALYRSTDGRHWTILNGPQHDFPNPFPPIFKVGQTGTLFATDFTKSTIYRSTTMGASWEVFMTGFQGIDFTESASGAFVATMDGGILQTTNAGVSWDTLYQNNSTSDPWPFPLPGFESYPGIIDWLSDGNLVCYDMGKGEFLVSPDNGLNWLTMPGTPGYKGFEDFAPSPKGYYVFKNDYSLFRTTPGDSTAMLLRWDVDDFFIGANGDIVATIAYTHQSVVSTDDGNTWNAATPYGLDRATASMTHEQLPGGFILNNGSYAGRVERSIDLGQTWTFSGYGLPRAWSFNWIFRGDQQVFAMADTRLWRSDNGGADWEIAPSDTAAVPGYPAIYNMALAPDGALYVLRVMNRLEFSQDAGLSFQDISPDTAFGAFSRLSIQPKSGDLFLVGNGGVLKSTDNGADWQVLNDTPDWFRGSVPIAFHPDGALFACINEPGAGPKLVRSDDGGSSWKIVSVYPGYNGIQDVLIDPTGKIYAWYIDNLYFSSDAGQTWSKRLVPNNADQLLLASDGQIFASDVNDPAIFYSQDDGLHWKKLPDLPTTADGVISMVLGPDKRLWVSTVYAGHYVSTLPTLAVTAPVSDRGRLSVFPNPASSSFTVKWATDPEQQTDIRLYNANGRMVWQQSTSGNACRVACPDWLPGVYWLEVTSGKQYHSAARVILFPGN